MKTLAVFVVVAAVYLTYATAFHGRFLDVSRRLNSSQLSCMWQLNSQLVFKSLFWQFSPYQLQPSLVSVPWLAAVTNLLHLDANVTGTAAAEAIAVGTTFLFAVSNVCSLVRRLSTIHENVRKAWVRGYNVCMRGQESHPIRASIGSTFQS